MARVEQTPAPPSNHYLLWYGKFETLGVVMNEIAKQTICKNLHRGNPAWGKKADGTGKSGNPGGAKHKADCLLSCIKESLEKLSLNGKTTREQNIGEALVLQAETGDMRAIEILMAYLHAKPTSSVDVTSKGEKIGNQHIDIPEQVFADAIAIVIKSGISKD